MFGGAKSPRFCGRLGARKQRGFLLIGRARALLPGGEINPLSAFAGNKQGWWREAENPDTLYKRRNLLTYSEQFDNAIWTKASVGVTPNTVAAPDGSGATADTITTVAAPSNGLYETVAVQPGAVYVGSVSRKLGTMTEAQYRVAFYDATNAAFIASDVATVNVDLGGGWYRSYYAITVPATCTSIRFYPYRNSANIGVATVHLWGAQLEKVALTTYQAVTDWYSEYMAAGGSRVTMWQDSAGTTPVTAVEQPVGKVLDRSGRGNHNIQATAADRPVLSARYNLTDSTEYGTAMWDYAVNVTTANAPDGACTITRAAAVGDDRAGQNINIPTAPAAYRVNLRFAKAAAQNVTLELQGVTGGVSVMAATVFNLNTGAVVSGPGTVTDAGSDWLVSTPITTNTGNTILAAAVRPAPNSSVTVNKLDVRTADDAAKNIPAYQRVNTASDYDTDGFPHYFRLNGTNQSWATAGTVDFTGTDKVSLVYGVTTIGAATTAILAELSATANSNNGSFYVLSPASAGAGFAVATRGTVAANAGGRQEGATAANRSAVFSSALNLAGTTNAETVSVRVNGVVATTSDLNTVNNGGNFGNYTAYTGRRAGSSLPFNGRIYSEIAVGATITATQITAVERYTARRMGVQL
jgi:hypothetical protein